MNCQGHVHCNAKGEDKSNSLEASSRGSSVHYSEILDNTHYMHVFLTGLLNPLKKLPCKMNVECQTHPGASTIESQLLERDHSHV